MHYSLGEGVWGVLLLPIPAKIRDKDNVKFRLIKDLESAVWGFIDL